MHTEGACARICCWQHSVLGQLEMLPSGAQSEVPPLSPTLFGPKQARIWAESGGSMGVVEYGCSGDLHKSLFTRLCMPGPHSLTKQKDAGPHTPVGMSLENHPTVVKDFCWPILPCLVSFVLYLAGGGEG